MLKKTIQFPKHQINQWFKSRYFTYTSLRQMDRLALMKEHLNYQSIFNINWHYTMTIYIVLFIKPCEVLFYYLLKKNKDSSKKIICVCGQISCLMVWTYLQILTIMRLVYSLTNVDIIHNLISWSMGSFNF